MPQRTRRFTKDRPSRVFAAVLPIFLATICFAQASGFEAAVALFQQKKWSEAESAFAEIERTAPGETDAPLYQGKALINLSRFADAETALLSYRAKHPQSDDAAYLLGYVLFREDKPKESLDIYTQAAKLKLPSADDLKIVALNYVLSSDYADAGHYLEMAVQMDPNNEEAHHHLGRVFYQQNRFDQATAEFQRVLQLDPRNAKAQNNLGLTLEAKNEVDLAIAAYRKAVELDRASEAHSEHAYLNLGNLLLQANKTGEALPFLIAAAQVDAKSPRVHYLLSKAYLGLDRVEDSRHEVEQSIAIDPKNPSAHYLLGRIYRRQEKNELANREFALTDELIKAQRANSSGMGGMGDEIQPKEMPQ